MFGHNVLGLNVWLLKKFQKKYIHKKIVLLCLSLGKADAPISFRTLPTIYIRNIDMGTDGHKVATVVSLPFVTKGTYQYELPCDVIDIARTDFRVSKNCCAQSIYTKTDRSITSHKIR